MEFCNVTTDLWDYLRSCGKPLALYGTGDGADKIIGALESKGLSPLISAVFASDGFVRSRQFAGFTVESFSQVQSRLGKGRFITLVCFGTSRAEVISNIRAIAAKCELYAPDVPVCGEGLFDMEYVREHEARLENVYLRLEDKASKDCFRAIVNYKLSGDINYLMSCESNQDDADLLLGEFETGSRMIDLGAYNGDTLRRYMGLFGGIDRAIAVEPERHSFRKLSAYCDEAGSRVRAVNALISDYCGTEPIAESHGRGSRSKAIKGSGSGICHSAETMTDVTTIDTLADGARVDFIKFDVEGSESAAINGGVQTITADRPRMLIACYHKNEDLFMLPEQILGLREDYKLYMRHHPYIPGWDTNYYFV